LNIYKTSVENLICISVCMVENKSHLFLKMRRIRCENYSIGSFQIYI